jgi:hypothetical protein
LLPARCCCCTHQRGLAYNHAQTAATRRPQAHCQGCTQCDRHSMPRTSRGAQLVASMSCATLVHTAAAAAAQSQLQKLRSTQRPGADVLYSLDALSSATCNSSTHMQPPHACCHGQGGHGTMPQLPEGCCHVDSAAHIQIRRTAASTAGPRCMDRPPLQHTCHLPLTSCATTLHPSAQTRTTAA